MGDDWLGYFDRQGNAIDLMTWGRLHNDDDYKRVALNEFPDGTSVSTVWLGLNHGFTPDSPLLIFETVVFGGDLVPFDQEMERYTTEAQAIAGHDQRVARIRDAHDLLGATDGEATDG